MRLHPKSGDLLPPVVSFPNLVVELVININASHLLGIL